MSRPVRSPGWGCSSALGSQSLGDLVFLKYQPIFTKMIIKLFLFFFQGDYLLLSIGDA